jgi:threonylcarbamoyladenosine tRNA methylthiotransferase MtaB
MVKIQDGCDNFCSFCIIPFVRGTAISRDPAEIIDSAQRMLDEGYRELVLTGVNMSRYEHGGHPVFPYRRFTAESGRGLPPEDIQH